MKTKEEIKQRLAYCKENEPSFMNRPERYFRGYIDALTWIIEEEQGN